MPKCRIQKFLSHAGIASRRKAEQLILDRKVRVNGKIVKQLGTTIDPEKDKIMVDGHLVRTIRKVVILMNKPRGYITTRKDEKSRKTVFDLVPQKYRMLHPVGRLDKETSGLLLLTNDGDLTNQITHPRYGVRKRYQVSLLGPLKDEHLQMLIDGFEHPDFEVTPCKVENYSYNNKESKSRFILNIAEGKKREIRKIFDYFGYELLRLHRIRVGGLSLRGVKMGAHRKLSQKEIDSIFDDKEK